MSLGRTSISCVDDLAMKSCAAKAQVQRRGIVVAVRTSAHVGLNGPDYLSLLLSSRSLLGSKMVADRAASACAAIGIRRCHRPVVAKRLDLKSPRRCSLRLGAASRTNELPTRWPRNSCRWRRALKQSSCTGRPVWYTLARRPTFARTPPISLASSAEATK